MKLAHLFLEYNVYNVNDIDKAVKKLVLHLSEELVAKLIKVVRREAVNNLDFLTPMKQVPTSAPDWAQQAVGRGDLYQFELKPELKDRIEHVGHFLTAALDDSKRTLTPQMPDFSFLNQRKIDAENSLKNLEKFAWRDLVKKSQDYFNALASRAAKDDSGTHTVLDTGHGYRWVELDNQAAFEREGKVLQNCIGSHWTHAHTVRQGQKILVLKDSTNASHVAARIKGTEIQEIKGKQNRPPSQRYMPATNALIQHLNLTPSEYALRDFEGSSYSWDTKTRTLVSLLDIYPPEKVADLANNMQLIKWTAPRALWTKSFSTHLSYYIPTSQGANVERYDLVQGGIPKISFAVAGDVLDGVGNITGNVATSALINIIKLVIPVLGIKALGPIAENNLSGFQVFWKDGQPVTLDEFLIPEDVMSVPLGTWKTTGMNNNIARQTLYNMGFSQNRISTLPGNVTTLKLVDASDKELATTYYTTSQELYQILRVANWDKSQLNSNLLPVMRKLDLKFNELCDLAFDKENKIDTFANIGKPILITSVLGKKWVKVPDSSLTNKYWRKYSYDWALDRSLQESNLNRDQPFDLYFLANDVSVEGCAGGPWVLIQNDQFVDYSLHRIDTVDQEFEVLESLLGKLNITSFVANHGNIFWKSHICWLPDQPHPQNFVKWALSNKVADIDNNVKIYRAPPQMPHDAIESFFGKSYKQAATYYLVTFDDSGNLSQAGFIAVSKNNKLLGMSARHHVELMGIAKAHLDQILGNAPGQTKSKIDKNVKKIKVNSRFHHMLRYIKNNPGKARSAWLVDHLGYRPDQLQQGSIESEQATDGFANVHKLITIRDPGRNPKTYQMRITPKGEKILARLDAGEAVPVPDMYGD